MEKVESKAVIEAILFAAGREVSIQELSMALEKPTEEIEIIIKEIRAKPNLSNAALETLAIIAYNPRITRAEIESIRGVDASASVYKLREYELIEEAGKSDLPGKPMTYKTTHKFLKMFGYTSLNDLPELPRYKLDENKQIVIDELLEEQEELKMKNKEQQIEKQEELNVKNNRKIENSK